MYHTTSDSRKETTNSLWSQKTKYYNWEGRGINREIRRKPWDNRRVREG